MFEIIGNIVNKILSKDSALAELFKGKEKKLQEFQLELIKHLENANIRQVEVNKIEAQNKNLFVSGWRPSVGWICSIALAYNYVLQPFIILIFNLFHVSASVPNLEIEQLITLLFSLLGMGGIRTYEKIKLNNKQ